MNSITIEEQDLDCAIARERELRGRYQPTQDCVLAQAARRHGIDMSGCSGSGITLAHTERYLRGNFHTLVEAFDAGEVDRVRAMLPLTVEVEERPLSSY